MIAALVVVDSLRLLLVLSCLALIGTNLAFVLHSKKMFTRSSYSTWRTFFIGKSILTLFVGLSAWERVDRGYSLGWRVPLGLAGLLVTNYALFQLLKIRGDEHGKEEERVGPPKRDSGFVTKSAIESAREEEI